MGVPARSEGNTATLELARDVPTAIMADLLGVSPETAVNWRQLAGGSWTTCASVRARPARPAYPDGGPR